MIRGFEPTCIGDECENQSSADITDTVALVTASLNTGAHVCTRRFERLHNSLLLMWLCRRLHFGAKLPWGVVAHVTRQLSGSRAF